jgi:hypothetical protein
VEGRIGPKLTKIGMFLGTVTFRAGFGMKRLISSALRFLDLIRIGIKLTKIGPFLTADGLD